MSGDRGDRDVPPTGPLGSVSRPGDLRIERDALGEAAVPADALWGIHTARVAANFPLAGRPVHPELVRAYGAVKLACARTNRALGVWADDRQGRRHRAAPAARWRTAR